VAGDPLERGVGDEHVDRFVRPPGAEVGDLEPDALDRVRLLDHRRGRVQTAHVRVGPALREQPGQVAGTAAQVDDPARRDRRDAGEQLDERPTALVGVDQVAVRVPHVRHRAPREGFETLLTSRYLDSRGFATVLSRYLDVKNLDR
jgi:hypothetical protein